MEELKADLALNIKINNPDLISKINIICTELSLSIDEFILEAINKLLFDINFLIDLRKFNNKC